MTQRVFDVENEKDMQDLWDILPDRIQTLQLVQKGYSTEYDFRIEGCICIGNDGTIIPQEIIVINWHDKTEITRPIQEATEQDIGKLCVFWDKNINAVSYDKLLKIDERYNPYKYETSGEGGFIHCRRLTKQEIEELC